MINFAVKLDESNYRINAVNYVLEINGHKFSIMQNSYPLATLDVRCGVPKTLDDDSGAIPDNEPSIPTLAKVDISDVEAVFVWENTSSLWEKKIYTLTCTMLDYTFEVTVKGHGRVDAVQYFIGDLGTKPYGSTHEFSEGFIPTPDVYSENCYNFTAARDFTGWSNILIPPMFCYAFTCKGYGQRIGFGLVAKRGEHNFNAFDYHTILFERTSTFWLETDQTGHVTVDGEWTAPYILGIFGDDQWEILYQYRDHYFSSGIAKMPKRDLPPRFWHGPIMCTWIEEECELKRNNNSGHTHCNQSINQEFCERMLNTAKNYGLDPKIMILDDKWQDKYGTNFADPGKFPNMREFVDKRHAEGIHVMLWFMFWCAEGVDHDIIVTDDNGNQFIDPSHPKAIAMFDEEVHRMLSSDDGCYDCDGFKFDYAFRLPRGRKVRTHSGKYGVELMYEMMKYLYTRIKLEKPDAISNNNSCHPYFAHICDQSRIHDYGPEFRHNKEMLSIRAKIFSIANPGVLLDTDNSGFNSRRDVLRWQTTQQYIGIPAIYAVSSAPDLKLEVEDYKAIAEVWKRYNKKIDAMYED